MKPSRGFTLIEILVVITIIGILAATVLASFSASRGRGNDTALKADLATIQVQATLYYGIGNTYGATNYGNGIATCGVQANGPTVFYDNTTTINTPVANAVASAQKDAGGANNLICRSTSTAFLVAGKLSDGKWWCVDNTGTSTEETQPATISC